MIHEQVVAGGVSTNFWSNVAAPELSPTSIYQPIASFVEKAMAGGHIIPHSVPLDTFCEKVAANVLKRKPSTWHWTGGMALFVWVGACIEAVFGHGTLVSICTPLPLLFYFPLGFV